MSSVLDVLDDLRRRYRVLFRVVHHFRKLQGAYRAGRGSQEIHGSFVLGAWGENSPFFEPVGKGSAVRVAVQCKDPPVPDFTLRLEFEGPPHDPTLVRLVADEIVTAASANAATDEAIVQALAVGLPTPDAKAVAKAIGKSIRTTRDGLRRLQDAGRVVVSEIVANQKKLYKAITQ
jgi:hypothetical protein